MPCKHHILFHRDYPASCVFFFTGLYSVKLVIQPLGKFSDLSVVDDETLAVPRQLAYRRNYRGGALKKALEVPISSTYFFSLASSQRTWSKPMS